MQLAWYNVNEVIENAMRLYRIYDFDNKVQRISELFMEFILEILFDIFIELVTYGGQEELEKKRFSRPVRFILIGLYLMVFIGATSFIILAGILVIRDNMFLGIILLLIAVFFGFEIIREIKKAYSKKNNAK